MGRTPTPALRDASSVVLEKGHSYVTQRVYVQLMVFTKWWTEIDLLTNNFGGKWYKHGTGYTWVLSRREDIKSLLTKLDKQFPSKTGFENLLLRSHTEQNKSDP